MFAARWFCSMHLTRQDWCCDRGHKGNITLEALKCLLTFLVKSKKLGESKSCHSFFGHLKQILFWSHLPVNADFSGSSRFFHHEEIVWLPVEVRNGLETFPFGNFTFLTLFRIKNPTRFVGSFSLSAWVYGPERSKRQKNPGQHSRWYLFGVFS